MAIPNQILANLVSGIPGELAFHGPSRALSAVIESPTESNNVWGRVFTYVDETLETVQAGGTGLLAGIMINPKAYALDQNYARNGTVGEFMFMGEVFVALANTGGTIGDLLYYVNATGEIGSGTASTGQTQIQTAVISRHMPSPETPTLAVARLTN